MLNNEHIKGQLHTKWAAHNYYYKEITTSTNDDAKELAENGAPHGTLVVADRQDKGRGSKGRAWETPAGTNIAMSLIVRPIAPSDKISMLTLIMGLSVAEGIEQCLGDSSFDRIDGIGGGEKSGCVAQIKWPNDVVIAGKKICGILTELHMDDSNKIADVVIGVGINVNMTEFPKEISEIAGSVLSTTGVRLDRGAVVAAVMERFEENYEKYNSTFDLSLLKEQYEKRLINIGKDVRVIDTMKEYEAVALGITEGGALIIRTKDGKTQEINAGEVTVRGLYSYV
ncbi:biotin--[acetyl-CoA-carboxylase] ligase [Butyrivibrio proteoclasticus]|uniref:biotin--[acetyl-CoA-carboxylase] ligase n=1 Tax=Butyrivibrio proteoclasticus TaxID=43305 RepID=UPI00055519BF|nr:biotin--[acetyl-CoA-carboxylase] ligase [Butyrivibrio proteoclasticus]